MYYDKLVHMGLCMWACACGLVHVALCMWACACGPVHVGLCMWACACGPVHVGLCMWELSGSLHEGMHWVSGHVLAVAFSPMIQVRRVWQALHLLGSRSQKVYLLVVQHFTLLKTCQSVTIGLQGLRGGHGLHPSAANYHWSCARLWTDPAASCKFSIHTLIRRYNLC